MASRHAECAGGFSGASSKAGARVLPSTQVPEVATTGVPTPTFMATEIRASSAGWSISMPRADDSKAACT